MIGAGNGHNVRDAIVELRVVEHHFPQQSDPQGMSDHIDLRRSRISRDGMRKGDQIREVWLRGGSALGPRGQILCRFAVIRNRPQLLRRIAGIQESLLDTLARFIPITGIAGIAVNKNDGAMVQWMSFGHAAPTPQTVFPFFVLQHWEIRGERYICDRRPAVSDLVRRGYPLERP